jgi:Mg/Co/Ni transporter MgtE
MGMVPVRMPGKSRNRHNSEDARKILALFLTTLTGTGGNAGNQSPSMVILWMSTGEINNSNMGKVICREILASSAIALILAAAAFGRVVMTPGADSTGATGLLFFSAFHWLSAAIILRCIVYNLNFRLIVSRWFNDFASDTGL